MSLFEGSDANPNPLMDLVGDDKKFKTVEDLAKGKLESDRFIDQLQSEMKDLRSELDARMSVEEALKKVKEQNNEVPSQNTTVERQGVELPDIEALVKQTVQSNEAAQKAKTNLDKAYQLMENKFGAKAEEMAQVRAKELGLTLEYVKATAEHSPEAFATLMGLNSPRPAVPQSATGGDVNTSAMSMGQLSSDETRLAELKNLMKTDKRKYFSRDVQNEVYRLKSKILTGG